MKKAKELGVEIRFNTKAVALLSDEKTGAVNGVRVKTKEGLSEIHSKFGVVLATGGFSANQAMVTQYIGSGGAKMPIRGSRIIAGENINLALPFMPKIVNVDQYHCGPIYGPTGANPLNIVNNGICVNDKGERFTDEGQTYVDMTCRFLPTTGSPTNAPRLPCTSVRRLTKRPKRQVFPLTPSRPLSRLTTRRSLRARARP